MQYLSPCSIRILRAIIKRETVKAGTQERGTERGTEVRRLYSLDWSGLDSPPKICKIPNFQCRTEAKHTYFFTKVACMPAFMSFLELVEVKGHVHI